MTKKGPNPALREQNDSCGINVQLTLLFSSKCGTSRKFMLAQKKRVIDLVFFLENCRPYLKSSSVQEFSS